MKLITETVVTRLIALVFVASVAWSLWATSRGWHDFISDYHGFRQAQTALTSYYMIRGDGSFLKYETPALGPPWSVPFEFPVYQWLAAKVSTTFGAPLVYSGRIVSVSFFALSLWALWGILSELQVARLYRLIFLSLPLLSPLYIFWSRSFLIESTAFFFCMAYLFFVLRYLRTKKTFDLAATALCGSLGALVKVTTFPAFLLAAGILYVLRERGSLFSLSSLKKPKEILRHCAAATLMAIVPCAMAVSWTAHADGLKQLNVLSKGRTSEGFHHWVYGTLSQKLDLNAWKVYILHLSRDLLGHPILLAGLIAALFLMRRHRAMPLVCIGLFSFVPLVFTNLHFVHRYYPYANGIFLLAALGWIIVVLLQDQSEFRRMAGAGLLMLFLAGSMYRFERSWDRRGIDPRGFKPELVEAIQSSTTPEDVIVEFGERTSWSSELPFYSERRGVVWPYRRERFREEELEEVIANLRPYRVGAVVFERDYRESDFIEKAIDWFGLEHQPVYQDEAAVLYLPAGKREEADETDRGGLRAGLSRSRVVTR